MKKLLFNGKEFLISSPGFSLVEAMVAAAVISVGIASIATATAGYDRASSSALPSVEAATLAEEGIEGAMIMRDTSWNGAIAAYTVGTPYALAWKSGTWTATTTLSYIDNTFWRTIAFQNVYRGGNDQIVTSGGTLDPNTRLVISSVSWRGKNATSTVTLSTYISNLFND